MQLAPHTSKNESYSHLARLNNIQTIRMDHPVRHMVDQARATLGAMELSDIEPLLHQALRHEPRSGQCLHLIGRVHARLNNLVVALRTYQDALNAGGGGPALFNDMGNVLVGLHQLDAAERAYRLALDLKPDLAPLYGNLAKVLLEQGRRDDVVVLYRQCLVHCPDDPVARHMLTALEGVEMPLRASEQYLRQTFDMFAETFDRKLLSLGYDGPGLIERLLEKKNTRHEPSTVLDLGCGTGLCGKVLRSHAQKLIGVDLSPAMLKKAAERKLYDDLIEEELISYLRRVTERFDVITAADVLCYFGDLGDVLTSAAGVLVKGGSFAFTVEALSSTSADYALVESGRFAHTRSYIMRVADLTGFDVAVFEEAILRQEYETPTQGYIVLLEKRDDFLSPETRVS